MISKEERSADPGIKVSKEWTMVICGRCGGPIFSDLETDKEHTEEACDLNIVKRVMES